jgi:hypothetical protein
MSAADVFRVMTVIASLAFAIGGCSLLSIAGEIATRQKTNVWNAARPEAGGALIFFALAVVLVANFFGLLD